jgi:ABC-2 type transport system permease protein
MYSSSLPILKTPRNRFLLFLWLRYQMLRASWQDLRRAKLKLFVIFLVWSILIIGLYALAYSGMNFLYKATGLGPFLVERIWYLFLFIVFLMIVTSQLASAYASIVSSSETKYWTSLPFSERQIIRAKYFESSLYSAWAALILIIPFSLAYLAVIGGTFWLSIIFVLAIIGLIGIATALSTMFLLVWVRFLGRIRIKKWLIPVGFIICCAVIFYMLGEVSKERHEEAWFVALQEVLPRANVASSYLVPSSWAAKVVLASVNFRFVEAGIFLFLIWMSCLLCVRLLEHLGFFLLPTVLRQTAVSSNAVLDKPVKNEIGFLRNAWWRSSFSSFIAKDVLVLLRDPMQWTQALVFFGLLGAYFANIHRINSIALAPEWRVGVASLNLVCTLLVFGSLGVRFLFPQMSLEGRRLWITLSIPGGFGRLFKAKLTFYSILAVLIVDSLLWLSATNLNVSISMLWWLLAVGAIAASSISCLTLGLGCVMIDLKAEDPSRVVSSSNGAITLVLMLLYVSIVGISLAMAWEADSNKSTLLLVLSLLPTIIASIFFGYFPARAGANKLKTLEL